MDLSGIPISVNLSWPVRQWALASVRMMGVSWWTFRRVLTFENVWFQKDFDCKVVDEGGTYVMTTVRVVSGLVQ